ncbi:MAG TPA: outer membrane protein assembly factor BamD [Tepidisphaeraceae bacterium]|nr:outer membrane protein assembly factor BamD [Tepidisphaeraceae bacterium]
MAKAGAALITLILLLLAPPASAQKTSELHGGRWIESLNPTTQQAVDPTLVEIEQLIQDGKYSTAQKSAVRWLKSHPDSPFKDRGLYIEAEALYQYGDRIKAYYYLDELLDECPDSPLFYQALEKQYQIADAYLNGYKRRFLRMPMFGAQEEAIEMLFRIQARAPKSPLAEQSLLRTADYYYVTAEYDLAADAYHAYVQAYPRSERLPRVMLREAYSNLAQFRGLRYDSTPVVEAKVQFEDIVSKYPDLANEENIPAMLQRIDSTFVRKLQMTADFYRRTHEPRAAAFVRDYAMKNYPNAVEFRGYTSQPPRAIGPSTNPLTP